MDWFQNLNPPSSLLGIRDYIGLKNADIEEFCDFGDFEIIFL